MPRPRLYWPVKRPTITSRITAPTNATKIDRKPKSPMPSPVTALNNQPPRIPPTMPTTIVPRHPRSHFALPPVTARANTPATNPTTIQPRMLMRASCLALREPLRQRVELVVERGREPVAERRVVLLDQRQLGAPVVLVDREQLVERTLLQLEVLDRQRADPGYTSDRGVGRR